MPVQDAETLKGYFDPGDVPTASNYIDVIDTIFDQGDPDHNHDDRYVRLSYANSIVAVHTFSPISVGPPFILASNAQGETVVGLRADELDKSVIVGDGLTGGGALTADVNVSLTLPGTLSVSSDNSSSGNHTHEITSSSVPTGESILACDASLYLTIARLNADVIGDKSGASLTLAPTGNVTLDPGGDEVLPYQNYDVNLGAINKKYLAIHAAELWVETLVAQNTIATIGGRILVGPTTVLTEDLLDDYPTNLVLNPGFETAGAGSPDIFDNWSEYWGTGNIVQDNTYYHDGSYSCKLIPGLGALTYVAQTFSVSEGEGYTLSFWTRGTGSAAGRYKVYDLTGDKDIIALKSTEVTEATWTEVSINFVIPTSCSTMAIYLYCPDGGVIGCHFDDVNIYSDVVYVKHNQMAEDDIVYMEADGHVEFMKVLSGPLGAGPYLYYVERNLDGTGRNDWYAGDALFNTGQVDNGFIDLYSIRGVKDGSQYGPTIVGNVRYSLTYNDWIEHWAIGNLHGIYGYGADTYGAAFGKYANSHSFLTIDATNGIRMRYKDSGGVETNRAQWDISGNILIGQVAASQDNIYITSGAIYIRNNTTNRITMSAAGVLTINDTGGNAVLTFDSASGAEITKKLTMPGANSAIAIGITPPTSPSSGTGIWIDRTGFWSLYSSTYQVCIDATNGKLYAGGGNVTLDANGITIDDGTGGSNSVKWTHSTTQILTMNAAYLTMPSNYVLANIQAEDYGSYPVELKINATDGTDNAIFDLYAGGGYSRARFNVDFIDMAFSNPVPWDAEITFGPDGIWSDFPIFINETADGDTTYGVTVNIAATTSHIFSGKMTGLAHGCTIIAETDTFGYLARWGSNGGFNFTGIGQSTQGVLIRGIGATDSTAKSTSADAYISIRAAKISGTSIANIGSNANAVVFRNNTTTTHIIDGYGNSHQDVGTAWTNFDDHDDVELLTALSVNVSREGDPIRDSFRSFLDQHKERLEELKLVTFNPDKHHFVNMSRLQMLTIGAVRQLASKVHILESKLLEERNYEN